MGEVVTVSGKGFAPHDPSDIRTAPAEVRLDSMTGPVLAKASPSSSSTGGAFSVEITVPDVGAGEHVIVVTQNGISGTPAYGTPARTVLTILPATPAAAPNAAAPALSAGAVVAPFVSPVLDTPAAPSAAALLAKAKAKAKAKARARALAACRSKYDTRRARTPSARKRMARKRASCIRAVFRRAGRP